MLAAIGGLLIAFAVLAFTIVLAVNSNRIPLPLRVLPPVGWGLMMLSTVLSSLPLVVVGGVLFLIGVGTEFVYGKLLGGSRRGTGRHGIR